MKELPEGWERSESDIAIAPWRLVSYVNRAEGSQEWIGAVTHLSNVITVYPKELDVTLSLRIQTESQLRELIDLFESAWRERR